MEIIGKLVKVNLAILPVILIIILGFAVYINSLNGKFIWDDYGYVKDNVYIKDWHCLLKIFTSDIGEGSGTKSSFYRPVQMITYMIDYSLWGLNVFGYHLINILLHILTAICIYWLVIIIFKEQDLALLASLLFITHPIHVEAVASIAGRADPLATVFMLLCIIFYIKQVYGANTPLYTLTLLSFMSALLSKESTIILPLLLLMYHYSFKIKINRGLFLSIVCTGVIYILLRVLVLKFTTPNTQSISILFNRIPGFFVAIVSYLRLLLLPIDLRVDYGDRLFNFTDPKVIFGMAIACFLIIYAFKRKNTDRLLFLSVSWFFISLLPTTNICKINDSFIKEHWLYVPSIGFFLILARTLISFYRIKSLRKLIAFCIISILFFYSCLTIKQNNYWKEAVNFLKRSLQYSPRNAIFYNELGKEYENAGKYEEASISYKEALEINPNLVGIYYNLAIVYGKVDKYEEAITSYKKALGNNPDDIAIYYNLAYLYNKIGDKEEAITMYKKARTINSKLVLRYYELGNKYRDSGKNKEAIALYKKALELDPQNIVVYSELANIYVTIGKNKEAIALLKRVLEIGPNFAVAHNDLAVAYYYEKQYDLAIKHIDMALKLGYKVTPKFLELIEPYRNRISIDNAKEKLN